MRKFSLIALCGLAAGGLVGTALAAKPQSPMHVMTVALPDGAVARIEYVGDIAPRVSVAARPLAGIDRPFPAFAGFDAMIADMNRQNEAIMRQVQQIAREAPAAPGTAPYVASFGNLPADVTSTSVVAVSNGRATCRRTTEVVSQGAGKPPKVVSNASGDCAAANAPAPTAAPPPRSGPIDRT